MATGVVDGVAATQDPVVCGRKHAAASPCYVHVQSDFLLLRVMSIY